jgi:hypothetical protein
LAQAANANSGRSSYFRDLIRGKPATYALALGCIGAFVYGAYLRDPLVMAAAPAGVVVLVLAVAAVLADRSAARSFFLSYADGLGLEYLDRWEVSCFTPLLGAGTRQWCRRWMMGELVKEPRLSGGLGYFFYERRQQPGQLAGRGRVAEKGHFTVCMIDIEQSLSFFKGVFLRPRRGLFELRSDWLADTPTHAVELESMAFTDKYELRASDEQDELALRELLSPTLVSWLAGHPLAPGFELRAGVLVVFVPKLLDDSGNLTFLLDAARKIAGHVVREVGEEDHGRPRPATSREARAAGL